MAKYVGNVKIMDAKIIFRNFEGREEMYNAEGKRNFCVLLNDDIAKQLAADGWKVKYLKPLEDGDEPTPYLKVNIRFREQDGNITPNIKMVVNGRKRRITPKNAALLDTAELETVDLIITPYDLSKKGGDGYSAWLKTLFAKTADDELESKYASIPDDDDFYEEDFDD